jgi:hypothetical protein
MQVVIPLSVEPLGLILHALFEGKLTEHFERKKTGLVFMKVPSNVRNKTTLLLTDIADLTDNNKENQVFHASSILSLNKAHQFLTPASEDAVNSGMAQIGFEGYAMEFVSMINQLFSKHFGSSEHNRFRLNASELIGLLSESDAHSNGCLYFSHSEEQLDVSLSFYRTFTAIGKPTERCGNRVFNYRHHLEVPVDTQY